MFLYILTLVFLLFFMGYIKFNTNDEVNYIKSSLDNYSYLVRKEPDSIQAANTLAKIRLNLVKLCDYLKEERKDDEAVRRLIRNFRPYSISESSPKSIYTSYSVNKGQEIVFCLRSKETNKIHDMNLLMYVALHELAHVMSKTTGHGEEFRRNFSFLIDNAVKLGLYKDTDFSINPLEYCGIIVG